MVINNVHNASSVINRTEKWKKHSCSNKQPMQMQTVLVKSIYSIFTEVQYTMHKDKDTSI